MEETCRVIVLGAASVDIKGRAQAGLRALTSNPGDVRLGVGGGARNVAENLARLGVDTTLMTVVGDDPIGQAILDYTVAAGVNIAPTLIATEAHTGAYLTLADAEGRILFALDDMDALAELVPDCIVAYEPLFYAADMIFVDANLPEATLAAVVDLSREQGIPLCADPTSAILAPRLAPLLGDIDILVLNAAEAQVYCPREVGGREAAIGMARAVVQCGVGTAVVTLGAEGVAFATSDESGWIPAFPLDEVVDTTGAGAALTAGVMFGLLNNVPLDEAVRLGASAAALTLQTHETVRSDLSLDLLYEQIMVF